MADTPVLGYWTIRGLAQPIRMLLEYTGTKFEDKEYDCGPAPDFDKSCWFDIKHSLGFAFPNLPYFIDGDVKLTQTHAILRYLGRKHDMCGKTEEEKIRVDLVAAQVMDMHMQYGRTCYNPDFENMKKDYLEKQLDPSLKSMEEYLGDRKFIAGDDVTFADFHLYEILYQTRDLAPEVVGKYKKLAAYAERFENLPKLKEYMASNRYRKRPFNNKMAKFGNV